MAMAWYFGTRNNDTLRGGNQDDHFWGNAGNDTMFGGAGNDTFYGGSGEDFFFGEFGSDTVSYASTAQQTDTFFGYDGVVVMLEEGIGGETGAADPDRYSSIENVTGSNFKDLILGDGNANVIRGLGGDDGIEGKGGADTLDGGDGIDMVGYNSSNARVVVDLLNNTASGGHATGDVISNFENVQGSAFNDILSGTNGANEILGGGGADTLNGRGGNDILSGGAGNDRLTGGSGGDTFRFLEWVSNGTDRITDFNVAQDRIEFDTVDGNGTFDISMSFDVFSNTFDVTVSLGNDDGTIILEDIAIADVGNIASRIDIV
jgi:Ca2+-binding RTX toxin-like protein